MSSGLTLFYWGRSCWKWAFLLNKFRIPITNNKRIVINYIKVAVWKRFRIRNWNITNYMDSDRNDFAILLDHDLNKKTYEKDRTPKKASSTHITITNEREMEWKQCKFSWIYILLVVPCLSYYSQWCVHYCYIMSILFFVFPFIWSSIRVFLARRTYRRVIHGLVTLACTLKNKSINLNSVKSNHRFIFLLSFCCCCCC